MSGLPSPADGGSHAEDGNPRSSSLLFEPLSPGPVWDAVVTLLSGGRHAAEARALCEAGEVYALVDVAAEVDEVPPAAAVVVPRDQAEMELALVAAPGPGGTDLVRRLLDELCDSLRRRRVARLVVPAAESDVPLTQALRAAGFRPHASDAGMYGLVL
jgi:hypothetical protein